MKLSLNTIALIILFTQSGVTLADEYGCKVLLCLSDPQGPLTQTECRPPIQRFIAGQNRTPRDPFPSCPEGAPASMLPSDRLYDDCPDGTRSLDPGALAVQMTRAALQQMSGIPGTKQPAPARVTTLPQDLETQVGIGDGVGRVIEGVRQNRICVGSPIGMLHVSSGYTDTPDTSYGVFERVEIIPPAQATRVVDIIVGGKVLRSVRY